MKKVLENVKLFVSMLFIGALLLYIATMIFMPTLTLKVFQFQPYTVVTNSMEPVIDVNDVVVVKSFNIDEAQEGDIITFKADIDYNGTEETVTHYIYSIDRTGEEAIIRTHRHFENPEDVVPDTWLITESQVIGAYGFHIQYLGYVIGFIKSIFGILTIAANLLIFGAIKFINNRARRRENQKLEQAPALS